MGGGNAQTQANEPKDEGGREAAALFLRMGRAGFTAPLCKNSDAERRRVLPPVERAGAQTRIDDDARDAAGVFARESWKRAARRHEAGVCVMGGLWTKHIKGISNHRDVTMERTCVHAGDLKVIGGLIAYCRRSIPSPQSCRQRFLVGVAGCMT